MLLVLVISVLVYASVSHAQSDQNGSADTLNATTGNQSMADNGTLSADDPSNLSLQNGTLNQSIENATSDQSVQDTTPLQAPPQYVPPETGYSTTQFPNGIGPESISGVGQPETGVLNPQFQNETAVQAAPENVPKENGPQSQFIRRRHVEFPETGSMGPQGQFPLNRTFPGFHPGAVQPPPQPDLTNGPVALAQTSGPTLSAAGIVASSYGVMDNDPSVNCPNITQPGTYTMATINYTGAPNSAPAILVGTACVVINASNVVFNCNGHTINGTAGATYGILVVGPVNNVTVQDCNVSKYSFGIYQYESTNSSDINDAAHNNSHAGIYFNSGSDVAAYNDTADGDYYYGMGLVSSINSAMYNDTANYEANGIGLYLGPSSSNDTIYDDIAVNGSLSGTGVEILEATNNSVYNNVLDGNNENGIVISSSSDDNIVWNNSVGNSPTGNGILISTSSTNLVYNNSANGNYQYGIEISSSSNNSVYDSSFDNTVDGTGVYLTSSTQNSVYNDSADGNYAAGIMLSSSNNDTLSNNSADNNVVYGIEMVSSTNDTMYGNTADNNTNPYYASLYLSSSNNDTFYGNYFDNNSQGIWLDASANNTLYNNTASNDSIWAFTSASGSTGDLVQNLTMGTDLVSFGSTDINIRDSAHPPESDPYGLSDIGDFVNITSNSPDSIIFLNMSYLPYAPVVNESTLAMAEYSDGWITDPSEFSSPFGVDTTDKYVFANISDPGAVFGIFNGTVSITPTSLGTNCPVISSPGNYVLSVDSSGAPNNEASPSGASACIVINASNVVLDCAGRSITSNNAAGNTYGILLDGPLNYVTVKDCGINGYIYGIYSYHSTHSVIANNTIDGLGQSGQDGIVLDTSSDAVITNNSVSANSQGIWLQGGSGSVINNNTVQDDAYWDLYVSTSTPSDCDNSITNMTGSGGNPINYSSTPVSWGNITASEIFLCNATGSNLTNVTVSNPGAYNNGIVLLLSGNTNITNSTAYSDWDGVDLLVNGGGNSITDSVLAQNEHFDFDMDGNSACNNQLVNVTGSGGRPINYTQTAVAWSNIVSSEMVLCGASYSVLTNDTVLGADATGGGDNPLNNVLYMLYSNHVLVVNSTSDSNYLGIYNVGGSYDDYTSDAASDNRQFGFFFNTVSYSLLANNTAQNNGLDGIQIYWYSEYDNLSGNLVSGNLGNGITLTTNPTFDKIYNDTVLNNTDGIYLTGASGNTISNDTVQDNQQYDFFNNAQGPSDCNDNVTDLMGSAGRPINYSNATVSWTGILSSEIFLCDADGSNLNGDTANGSDSIGNDGVVLFYTDYSDVVNSMSPANYIGYYLQDSNHNDLGNDTTGNNSQHGFYLFNSSYNTMNSSVSEGNAQEGFYLNSNSDHNSVVNCTENTSYIGVYAWGSDYNNVTSTTAYDNRWDGIRFDDSVYSLAVNDTAYDGAASGFVLTNGGNSIFANDTSYGNAYNGFYAQNTTLDTYANDSSYEDNYGIYLDSSSNNVLYNDSAQGSAQDGFELVSSNGNTLYDSSAGGCSANGIDLYYSSSNDLSNNSAGSNLGSGIGLLSSDQNALSNDSAFNDSYGVDMTSSDGNTLSGNSAYNSTSYGFGLESSDLDNLSNNSAYDNAVTGIYMDSSEQDILSGNSACNNSGYGIYLESSDQNTLSNDTADDNSEYGIYSDSSDLNTLSNDSADDDFVGIWLDGSSDLNNMSNDDAGYNYYGVFISESNQNGIYNSSADNNSGYGVYLESSDQDTLSNDSADNNSYVGMEVYSSDQNDLYNDSASGNQENGIELDTSSQNTLYNNSAMENGYLDLVVYPSSQGDCQDNITDTVGSAYRPVYYSNDSVSWAGLDSAEIELCGASGSNVTNSAVDGSDTLYNDGFLVYYSDNATIDNTSSSDNAFGFYISTSDNGTYAGDSADSNGNSLFSTGDGFGLYYSNALVFTGSSAIGDSYSGFDLDQISNSSFADDAMDGNHQNGFYMYSSDSNNITSSSASGNGQDGYVIYYSVLGDDLVNDTSTGSIDGFYLYSALGNNLSGCNASGNTNWGFSSSAGSTGNTVDNLTLGNDSVSFDSQDIDLQESGPPQEYPGGSPSVEVQIASSDAGVYGYDEKVTGISEGLAGTRDITSFGPTSGAYDGAVAYIATPDGGAVSSSIPTEMTPVSDISSPQTISGGNVVSGDITLPFNVTLFGRQNDHIAISTNGFIYLNNETVVSTDPGTGEEAGMDSQDITAGSDYMVAGLWADLFTDGVDSTITYGVVGTAPNRVYVISYDDATGYDSGANYGNDTFEIDLLENGTDSAAIDAPDPSGLYDIGRFVESAANSPDSYLFLNLSYLASDVVSLDPSTLFMAKYDESGWDVTPSDFSYPYGVDTSDRYVFANITGFGSVFGILGGTPPSPSSPPPATPSSPPSRELPMSLSLYRAPCPANQVTVTAYSGANTGLRLLLTSPYEGLVDEQATGSDGTATFSLSANGTYEVDASKAGYGPGSETFTFATCAVAPALPSVTPPVTTPGCTSDSECPSADFCNLASGACQPVTGACGFAAGHAWSAYQCCQDSDCAISNVCISHACEPLELTGDDEGLVGGQGEVHATVGGEPFANATLQIVLPDGASFQTTTDANGDILLPFSFQGNYTVNLLVDGVSARTHLIAVALPPPATLASRPAVVQQPVNYCWVLPVIVAMILAYLTYRKWRAGKEKKKQPLKP
jgi:parallel beta-helix repeat protein